jgi:hypothetical protein
MERITVKDLEAVCARINRVVNGTDEVEPWTRGDDGHLHAAIGVYHLSGAYGGYGLHRMMNDGGGVDDVFYGHYPKRELYSKMQAFLKGIEATS